VRRGGPRVARIHETNVGGGCTLPTASADAAGLSGGGGGEGEPAHAATAGCSSLFLDTTRLPALERDRASSQCPQNRGPSCARARAGFRPVTRRDAAGGSWNKFRLNIGFYKNSISLHRRRRG